jgi:exosome complex component RRP43
VDIVPQSEIEGETANGNQQDNEDTDMTDKVELPNLVWYLNADIYCLNYDGNVLDACLIGLLAALRNGKLLLSIDLIFVIK